MRNFDYKEQFNSIVKSATDALKSIFPIVGKIRVLSADRIWVEDKLDPTDYSSQNKIKSREGTWGVPVYAELTLKEKSTGTVLDRSPKVKLFNLPKITDRFSYIVKGNEYQVTNQLRLKPGAYTIRKQNGELKTQVNLARGKNFDLSFNETSGKFTIQKIGGGQANIPLYPILTYLGVSPQLISKEWGAKLEMANRMNDPKIITRAAVAFGVKRGDLKSALENTQISPETTKETLGFSFERVDGPFLLAASKNLLDIHMGKKDPVDRDSLAFKELHSIEDFIHERIEKNKDTIAFKFSRNIDNPRRVKISQLLNPEAFNSVIENFFTQDDKSNTSEQTNPLEMFSGAYRVTIMGSGGIKSDHAITPAMREIHSTHYGFLDPIHSPESNVGVNMHIALGAIKDGKSLKTVVVDKDKKPVILTPSQAHEKVIAFPSQKGNIVKALHKGKVVEVSRSKVDYYTPHPMALFSPSTNLIPYLQNDQGNRSMMASKMLEQAISLKHREEPLVQVGASPTESVEEVLGKKMAVLASEDGVVKKITPDFMMVQTKNGSKKVNLYNNYDLNRKSFLHHIPVVKVGDKVKAGQLLADSNYTRNGVLALGTNLKTAYLPYKGLNFDDGIVITESAAEKLTSEHIHKKTLAVDENTILNLVAFKSNYPNAISPTNSDKLDGEGIIKKGSNIKMGEVLIAALRKSTPSSMLALLSKGLANRPRDISVHWPFENDGEVLDVVKTKSEIRVLVRTEEKAKIGDKLTGRHGNKGVITHILPDGEAPRNAKGDPVEVMLQPAGIISRINIGQIYDSAAGKVAAKTGTPHKTYNFTGEDYLKRTKELMKKHGVSDKEELFDTAGKSIGKVHVGKPYILKLFKQSTGNFSARQGGPGHPYDANMQPLKAGGAEASKSVDLLTLYCLLSHGARANLREISALKGSSNDEIWKALKAGQPIPAPKAPFVYDKFLSYLKGAGIDVKKEGTRLQLAPLTDESVRTMSSGEIKKPVLYNARDLKPKQGGLFDPAVTGGYNGNKWSHIELTEPTLNPVFEDAAKKITGIGKKFDEILAGKAHVDSKGDVNTDGKGVTGGAAIESLLKKIDVNGELERLEKQLPRLKASALDDANKRARYLKALKEAGLKPHEAYIRKLVPVVPTAYRPIYPMPNGNVTISDLNFLYQNVGVLNTMMKMPVMELLPESEKANIRSDVYKHVKGLAGLTDLPIKGRLREGFISEIKGSQPKEGFFISKLLSKKQDFVGRGTAIPNPDLHIDELGMPEEMAWKLFEPFIVRELKMQGKTPVQALKEIKDKSFLAKRALEVVMRDRHVLLNRAPSLHKFSVMAFKPKLVTGRALRVQPLINKGFNLDFDGDTVTAHVPITEEANKEAEKMLPSRNLFQPGSGNLMILPSQEAQIGLYYLTSTPQGRSRLNKILPKAYQVKEVLDKKTTKGFLNNLARNLPPNEYGVLIKELKTEGEKHAFEKGFTLGVDDLKVMTAPRNTLMSNLTKRLKGVKDYFKIKKLSDEYAKKTEALIAKTLKGKNNPLYDMVVSGAKGSDSNTRSILATPVLVTDAKGKIIPKPITRSYSEGLGIDDYWVSMYGARRGMMDRSIQTSLPGAFSKDIMATTVDNVISGVDCGTKEGIELPIDSSDALDRFLAGDQRGVAHNTLVDAGVVSRLRRSGARSLKVRSPLRCLQPKGTCSRCYGIDEHGHPPDVGDNIGAKAGQTISEPLVQITMNSFHTGGTATTKGQTGGFARINQLLQLPKIVVGAAALSPIDGRVTKIVAGLAGGFDVFVGDQKVHAEKGLALKVKQGQTVKAGDPLSEGTIKPQDLVKLKGMKAAQAYIATELKKAYEDQGVKLHGKIFETVVRSLGNVTKVMNKPKDTPYLPGDVVPYTMVEHHNKNLEMVRPLAEAEGYKLAKSEGGFKEGHELTREDLLLLKARGIKEVTIMKDPIIHAPLLKGMSNLPLLRRNWMATLGYRYLAKTLKEGAGQGWTSDLSDYHPIPAFAHGETFGKGPEGKY